MPKYESFWAMAEAIFATVAQEGLDGIVPLDNPADLTVGYMAALPFSKRKEHHYWCVYIGIMRDVHLDPRYEEVRKCLADLETRARTSWEKRQLKYATTS